jgi:hypothetical protein
VSDAVALRSASHVPNERRAYMLHASYRGLMSECCAAPQREIHRPFGDSVPQWHCHWQPTRWFLAAAGPLFVVGGSTHLAESQAQSATAWG